MYDDGFDDFLLKFFIFVVVLLFASFFVWFGYELNDNQYENCKIEIIEEGK